MTNEMRAWLKVLGIAAVAIVCVEIIYWIGVAAFVDKPESAGTFGDMYGALNTFFAGLAFSGVIFTLHLQMKSTHEARQDQLSSIVMVQNELALLREDIDLQRERYRVEAGPFFRLANAGVSGSQIEVAFDNVGAPVIVTAFTILTPGCSVRDWSPATLAPPTRFTAICLTNNPSQREYRFGMVLRDRWGADRVFELHLVTHPHARLDFFEVRSDPRRA